MPILSLDQFAFIVRDVDAAVIDKFGGSKQMESIYFAGSDGHLVEVSNRR